MNKLVLISNSTYQPEHDALLKSFLDQKFELFCVVGEDCELREEAMDELAIGDGENSIYITTTSHPSESAEEVIEFAKVFNTKSGGEVRVVHIQQEPASVSPFVHKDAQKVPRMLRSCGWR